MGIWPNLESNLILCNQITYAMEKVWWFYETLLLNLISDQLEWFGQLLRNLAEMVRVFIQKRHRKQIVISVRHVLLLIFNAKHVLPWYGCLWFWNKLSYLEVVEQHGTIMGLYYSSTVVASLIIVRVSLLSKKKKSSFQMYIIYF